MKHRSPLFLLGLILTAVGLAAAARILEPLHSNTMLLSWGILGLPIGVLLLLGDKYSRATQITLRILAVVSVVVSLIAAVAIAMNVVPLSPELATTTTSPWFWIQTGATTLFMAGAIWMGGDFVARLAEVARGGTSTAAG